MPRRRRASFPANRASARPTRVIARSWSTPFTLRASRFTASRRARARAESAEWQAQDPPELDDDDELLEPLDDPPFDGGSGGGAGSPHFAYSAAPMLHEFVQSNANVRPLHSHEPWPHGPPFTAVHWQLIV